MPKFMSGTELLERLREELKVAHRADFAVAFWGGGAADNLGIRDGTNVRIICNLMSGGTNPKEIRILQERGAEVRQLNDLHAKIGVVGDVSFLGSSNMSANGLGVEGEASHWRESNVVYCKACSEIANMFSRFWDDAVEIEENDLVSAERVWVERQRRNAIIAARRGGRSLVDVLRTAPEELDVLNVRMVVYDVVTDVDHLAILNKADQYARKAYGDDFEVYWDWDSMTTSAKTAYLVDYDWPSRGQIARRGIFYRNDVEFPDFKLDEEMFHPACEIDDIEGITFGTKDKKALRSAFHAYVRAGGKSEAEGERAYNFPISALARYLPPVT